MYDLSIIIKTEEKGLKNYIEALKPLLAQLNTELIIIDNDTEAFDIPYEHSVYTYSEDYYNYKKYCMASSLGERVMIIEQGICLMPELVQSIMKELEDEDYFNISYNRKTYISKDKSQFLFNEEVIVYNRGIRGFNKNIGITVEDNGLIGSGADMETNIKKLILGNHLDSLFLWHEHYILNMPYANQLAFYTILEDNKLYMEEKGIIALEKLFLKSKAKNKYMQYLMFRVMHRENKKECNREISTEIQHIDITKQETYYCWLLKGFFLAEVIPDFMIKLTEEVREVLMEHLFNRDEAAPTYIYNLIMISEGINTYEHDQCTSYLYIIMRYIRYVEDKSEEPLKKEKLLRVFDLYIDMYNLFLKHCEVDSNNSEVQFIDKFNRVRELLLHKNVEDAIIALKQIGIDYPEKIYILRYYIQKIRYDNNEYSYKISVCMITKNESKNLDRCLSSLKPLVEANLAEIIIVDTGSTDNTVDIAKHYTNAIYDYQWQNNFSHARNYSILFADGKYILIMDADEEFEASQIQKIIEVFCDDDKHYNTFTFRIKSYTDIEYTQYGVITQQRIFRNNGQFYYESTIHNQPVCAFPTQNLDVEMLHYGYIMTEDIREKKFLRTTTLLKKMLEKEPRNIYYRYQLSSSYSMYGDLKEALRQVDIFIRLINEKKRIQSVTLMYYNNAAIIYIRGRRYDDAERLIDKALALEPDFIDFIYYKAYLLSMKNYHEDALVYISKYLTLSKNFYESDVANNAMYAFYTLGNRDSMLRLYINANYSIAQYGNCIDKVYEIEEENSLSNCLHEIIDAYFYTQQYDGLAGFYKKRVKGHEKREFIFNYFLWDNLIHSEDAHGCMALLEQENIAPILIEKIKTKTKEYHSMEESYDLISKYYMDGMAFERAKKIYENILPLLKKDKLVVPHDLTSIKKMKIVTQCVLHQTQRLIDDTIMTTSELMDILMMYIQLCLKLIDMKEVQFLEMKERLFIAKVLSAFNNDGDISSRLQLLKDAIIHYSEMTDIISIVLKDSSNESFEKQPHIHKRQSIDMTSVLKLETLIEGNIGGGGKDNQEVKVIHGSMDLTDRTMNIAKALTNEGIATKAINYLPSYLDPASDYEMDVTSYDTDIKKINYTIDVASRLITAYDIFHFHSFTSLTLDHSDLSVLKSMNKKMFMHFWGQDVRIYAQASRVNPYIKVKNEENDLDIINQLKFFSSYMNTCIVSDYELHEYVKDYFENVIQLNLMVDVNKYKPMYDKQGKKIFTILHVTTSPELYGTKYILEAINELKLRYDINFKFIQERSAGNAIHEADLVIDQLIVGRYGPLSIEAMALGKPVICWISEFMKEKYPREMPVIIANPDNIKEKIRYVLDNRDMLREIGMRGRQYVEKYHDVKSEIQRLIKLYTM